MIYSNCKRFSVIFQHIKFYIVPVHNVLDFIFWKSLWFSSEHSQTQKTVQDSRQPPHMNLRQIILPVGPTYWATLYFFL